MTSLPRANQLLFALVLAATVSSCTSINKDVVDGDSETSEASNNGDVDSDSGDVAGTDASSGDGIDEDLAGEDLGDGSTKTADAAAPSEGASDGIDIGDDEPIGSTDIVEDDLKDTGAIASNPEPVQAGPSIEEPPTFTEPTIDEPPVMPVAEGPSIDEPVMASSSSSTDINVTDLRYSAKKGGGTVVIETSGPASFKTREVPSQNQVVVEVANARLPDRLKRPYVTKDFGQSIASVNAYQDPGSSTARFVIQFKGNMKAAVTQSGSQLLVVAADGDREMASTIAANDVAAVTEPEGDEAPESDVIVEKRRAPASKSFAKSSTEMELTGDVRFYGKPINIEVRDTPVKDVISLIAEQSGANIVLAGVDGQNNNISLKLRQIPWDQALMIVMKAKNLGYVRQGTVLRIAPLEMIQKETDDAKKILDAQKAAEPLKVKVIPVSYAKVDELEKKIATFLTPSRGKVASDLRTSSVIVTDTVDILDRVSNLIKALDTPPLQVLIEGKVVEAREVFNQKYGINWGYSGQDLNLGGGLSLGNNLSIDPSGTPLARAGANMGFRFGRLDLFGDLAATLALAESEDLVKVVSSPRVVTMNNSPAMILQSNNVFVSETVFQNGVSKTTFTRQPIELRLEVTPQITAESDVIMSMKLKREFEGAARQNLPPDINTREANTTVMVRNGQTAVVGGIYQSDVRESDAGVPYLKEIPILGWLFKSHDTKKDKTELLLFLTPRILNAEKALAKESSL